MSCHGARHPEAPRAARHESLCGEACPWDSGARWDWADSAILPGCVASWRRRPGAHASSQAETMGFVDREVS